MDMLLDKEIAFGELRQRATRLRSLQAVKTAFVQTTNGNNWEIAREWLPYHGNRARPKTFASLSFKGTTLKYVMEYRIQIISCIVLLDKEITFGELREREQ